MRFTHILTGIAILFAVVFSGFTSQRSVNAAAPACDPSAYVLNISRTFGYSSGSEIRGLFTLSVSAPAECIQKVEYLLDGKSIQEISVAPFSLSFDTSPYPTGEHQLSAQIATTDGQTTTTPARVFVFATAAQEKQTVGRILFPVLGVIILVFLVTIGLQMLGSRRQTPVAPGTPRNYGVSGGAVCPKCGRPFVLHFFTLHLGFSKVERCPNCGKWSLVSRSSLDELRAAEARELKASEPQLPNKEQAEEDELKKMIDDSKFSK